MILWSFKKVFFVFESKPRTSSAMALSLVLIRELLTTGEISGINAFALTKRLPSVSIPLLRCASMMVFIVPIICGMIWNTELIIYPKRGEKPACSRSSTRAAGFVVSTNMAKARSMFKMLSPIREA